MAYWRKVDLRLHNDEKFRALSMPQPNGQDLFLDLIIGRRTTNIPGVVVARVAVLADDRRWSVNATKNAIDDAIANGMVDADFETGLIWLPNAPKQECNKPNGPNTVRSWGPTFDELPECPLKATIWEALRKWVDTLDKSFAKAFDDVMPNAIADVARAPDQNENENEKKYTLPPEFDFESVYRSYPKKSGKQKGLEKCRARIKTVEDFEAFRSAVETMANLWHGHDTQFCPIFSTFVNQERWRDEELPRPNGVPAGKSAAQQAYDELVKINDAEEEAERTAWRKEHGCDGTE